MRKLWKGVLLGAAVGATVKAVQEVQGDGDIDQVGPAVAKAAGQAAIAGAAVGFLLDRRDRRKLTKLQKAKAKAGIGSVVAGAGALADAALPAIQQAAEVALEKATKAAETAKPHVVHAAETARDRAGKAADTARPHAMAAAEVARDRATRAADAARPHVEHAANRARPHVEHAADAAKVRAVRASDAARTKLAEYDLPVIVAV